MRPGPRRGQGGQGAHCRPNWGRRLRGIELRHGLVETLIGGLHPGGMSGEDDGIWKHSIDQCIVFFRHVSVGTADEGSVEGW
jgi:hypothetical protein